MSQTDCFWCAEMYDKEVSERCPNCNAANRELKLLPSNGEVVGSQSQDGSCCSNGCSCRPD